MTILSASVRGIGAWSSSFADWPAFVSAAHGDIVATDARPVATVLPPAERRRAPPGVAVALTVAREATASLDGRPCAAVFASAYGDLAIVDDLCATLASDPSLISPTRFHHSVHNAAAGYWSIATGDRSPATAIAAGAETFGHGLLEALVQVTHDRRPVLLVCFDTPAAGPLAAVVPNTALFGAAWLLVPAAADDAGIIARLSAVAASSPVPRLAAWRPLAASSPAAQAIVLLEACMPGAPGDLRLPLGPDLSLDVTVRPAAAPASGDVRTIG